MLGRLASLSLIVLVCVSLLSACTGLAPVYSQAATDAGDYTFSYGKPANRSDQVIYRELRLKFPERDGATDSYVVNVTSYNYARSFLRKSYNVPTLPYEMVVVATVTVTSSAGATVLTVRRTESAGFNYVSQVLTDKEAEAEAVERASIAAAESIRLGLLAGLRR